MRQVPENMNEAVAFMIEMVEKPWGLIVQIREMFFTVLLFLQYGSEDFTFGWNKKNIS